MEQFDAPEAQRAAEEIQQRLTHELDCSAAALVHAYLVQPDDYRNGFAGLLFDELGADESSVDRYTIADLLAVTTLDVAVPPKGLRQLFDNERDDHQELLVKIPWDVTLWDTDEAAVAEALSAADEAWVALVNDVRGVGWVTAGKLLARKRPRLIPVYDKHVKAAFGDPPSGVVWAALHVALRSEQLRDRIEALRPSGPAFEGLSLLRLLDIAVWMRRSNATSAREVRDELGIAHP